MASLRATKACCGPFWQNISCFARPSCDRRSRGDEAGEMIEFEVMIRPAKALQALGEEMGNRIGPQVIRLKQAAAEV